MKSLIRHFVLITIFSMLSFSIVHAETYPVFEWAKRSNITNVLLSPDGEKVALLRNDNFIIDKPILEVYDANNLGNRSFRMNSSNTEIIDFYWIADDKIILTAKLKERDKIEGYNEGIFEYLTGVLTLDKNPQKSKLENLNKLGARSGSRPYIESSLPKYPNNILLSVDGQYYNYNVKTGKRRVITREHGGVYSIRFDEDANPRFARGYDAKKNERLFYYREADSKKWEVIHRQHISDFERWRIQGFDPANPSDLLIIANNGHDKQGLWSFDPKTKKYKELIYRRSDVDVVSTVDHTNRFTNEDTITAIRYFVGREEKFQWFDREEQAIYEQLKSLVPNSDRLSIRSRSRDGMSIIIRNRGPRDPGTYYLLKNGELKVIGSTKPQLSSEHLADVEAITYETRDGKKIRGFITIPNSKSPYPLVVMPHGGPFVGENPSFDEWAQMLANRGFMVLQPQYRGSKYFGLDFYKTAFIDGGQGGYQMQDDKDDGALYLVEKGLVDPNRMMMFGWSYGGYASLIAAARSPQIYQCVIAGASFPDPIMQVNYYRNRLNRSGGSTAATEQLNMWLKSMSPIEQAAEVNIPILIVHGDVDQRTPPKAVRKYIKALKKYNKDHKAIWLKGADHFSDTLFFRHKLEFYSEVEKYIKTDCFKNTKELKAVANSVSITKVIETDASSPYIKTVELYVTGTVDFSDGSVVMNYGKNGAAFADNQIDISGLGVQTDTYVYVIRDLTLMQTDFPSAGLSASNTVTTRTATNGDDSYQITMDGAVISQFGVENKDGTGTAWEHRDTYAERKPGTEDDGTFSVDHWTIQALNFLDDYGTYNGAAALETVITLGNWKTDTTASIVGDWKLAPMAAALGVGWDAANATGWWSNSADDVTTRACLFDDIFRFGEDGSFANVMGSETWLEGWQGADGDQCGTPVVPHDGSNAATYTHDASTGALVLTGKGAHVGLPKAFNGGELTTPADAPDSVTYTVTELSESAITIQIQHSGDQTAVER